MKNATAKSRIPAPGARFELKGREWIALGMEQGGLLAIAAESIGDMPFDEDWKNDWRTASLRQYLNGEWLADIGTEGLLPFMSDLISDDGLRDYGTAEDMVFLLSCDLYRKYREFIPTYNDWWWTLTPWSCYPSSGSGVRYVVTSGALYDYDLASNSFGVVPCLLIDLSSFGASDERCDSGAEEESCTAE